MKRDPTGNQASAVSSKTPSPHKIIYTDAPTGTSVAAAIVFDREEFIGNNTIATLRGMYADKDWADLFNATNLIYGLELLAAVQTAAGPSVDLDGKCVTFYADNNAIAEILRADSEALIISISARIFWAICIKRNIAPWFGRVQGKINISDFPTRFAELPYRLRYFKEFPHTGNLLRMIRVWLAEGGHGFSTRRT